MRKPTLNIEFWIWWRDPSTTLYLANIIWLSSFLKNNHILFILQFWLLDFFSDGYSLKKTMKQIFARILCAKHLGIPMNKW